MIWSPTDIAVVFVFASQLAAWGVLFAVILKVKRGPLAWLLGWLSRLQTSLQRLTTQGSLRLHRLLEQAKALGKQSQAIRRHFRLASPPVGMWLHPRQLLQLRTGLLWATQLRRSPLSRQVKKRPSPALRLAQRLGLLPPVLTKLLPLRSVATTALQVLRQLRR